jgi:hypothetical protein
MAGDCTRRSEPDSGDCWDSCCCAFIWLFSQAGLGMHVWLHKVSHAAISVSLHLPFLQHFIVQTKQPALHSDV